MAGCPTCALQQVQLTFGVPWHCVWLLQLLWYPQAHAPCTAAGAAMANSLLHGLIAVLRVFPTSPQVTMSSNYFGPLYLTLQLLDVVQASSQEGAPSRIVWVNSVGSQLVNPPYLGGNSWAPGED